MSFEQKKADVLKDINEKLQILSDYQKYNKLKFAYPDTGEMARDLYPKHLAFFNAGSNHRLRLFSGGNGTGKSHALSYEVSLHCTGLYPDWWTGKRLKKPKLIWVCAKNGAAFRDGLQNHLLGPHTDIGTGFIPKDVIGYTSVIPNSGGAIGTFQVKHVSGEWVQVVVKTYDMDDASLRGANVDLVAFDEEPPYPFYEECVLRTRGTKTKEPGICMIAATPQNGLTDVVLAYLPQGMFPKDQEHPIEKERWAVAMTWDECPHYSEEDKATMMAEIPPHLRCARTRGIPALGTGRVYPIHEDDIIVDYLKIASHWPRAYGLDFGWNCTAAIWGAKDPETGVLYLYGEYYKGEQAPHVHTFAIKGRGSWIPGICDPRGDRSSERDGSKLIDEYRSLGLNLEPGDNSIQSGIARILNMMEAGLLKVTYNLEHWLEEFRVYRYDLKDPNKIARNQKDHLMDATRYLVSLFDAVAISHADHEDEENPPERRGRNYSGRNQITGY